MALSRSTARSICAANAQTGLTSTDPRLDTQIDQAMARLVRHRNAFVRGEEYDAIPIVYASATDPLQLDAPDALKLMVLALWREENNRLEEAGALEQRAYQLIDQDIVQSFEATNKAAYVTAVAGTANTRTWYAARLGLDTNGGLGTSNTKLKRLVSRAASWIYQKVYEYQLIERNRIHSGVPTLAVQPVSDSDVFNPVIDYETLRLVVQAMALEGYGPAGDTTSQQAAGNFLQEAATLLSRKLTAELEVLRHGTYTTALGAATAGTFAYVVAKLALELPLGIKLSDGELGRLTNSAEQRLVESGKWKFAIADYDAPVSADGTVTLPAQAETVLSAWACAAPLIIRGETYEGAEGGQGLLSNTRRGVGGTLVARPGEVLVDGAYRKTYFLSGCAPAADSTIRVRCKRRFVSKAGTDRMQVQNFGALKAAAQCLLHEGTFGAEIGGVPVRDPQLAAFYWTTAKAILSDEVAESRGGEQTQVSVQYAGFGAGEIPSIL